MRNTPILIAGAICLFTAFLHLIGGQSDHVVPMLGSDMSSIDKGIFLGVWHMVTLVLFLSAFILIKMGRDVKESHFEMLRWQALLHIFFGVLFIVLSVLYKEFLPQWILFLPIGGLILFGLRKGMNLETSDPKQIVD